MGIGTGRQLLDMLKGSRAIREEMDIIDVFEEPENDEYGFTALVEKRGGAGTENKAFTLSLDIKTVLYIKSGGAKMPMMKPWDLFEMEAELVGPDATEIPPVLLS